MYNGLSDFLHYLMEGLKVALHSLQMVEFTVESSSFNLIDLTTYSVVISSVLRFISAHYSGSWRGDHKQVNRKVD